ncbi:hypothetical protein ABZW49_34975 [Nonomuraea wenchangensis]
MDEAALGELDAKGWIGTAQGALSLRRVGGPVFPPGMLDDPYDDPTKPERPICVDFSGRTPGNVPNPLPESGMVFAVQDRQGQSPAQASITRVGLEYDARVEVRLPRARAVRLEVRGRVRVEAWNADGSAAASATGSGSVTTLELAGTAITRIVLETGGTGEPAELIRLCAGRWRCVTPAPRPGTGPNPLFLDNLAFEESGAAETRAVTWGGLTGLDCGQGLDVTLLGLPARTVSFTVARFAGEGLAQVYDGSGTLLDEVRISGPGARPLTFRLTGRAIRRLVITPDNREMLLLETCVETDTRPPLGPGPVTHVPPEPELFLLYELELYTSQKVNRVSADTPYALTILMLGHEVVAAREGDPHDQRFAAGPADKMLLYARSALRELTICVDGPVEEEQDWAGVPYLVTGIQLPIGQLDGTLGTPAAELAAARARALPGEQVDPQTFADVTSALKETLEVSRGLSPVSATLRTRADATDPFHSLQAWPFVMSLAVDPLWRRVLGLGWLDTTAVSGTTYDYRITGRFRRGDIDEILYGFQNVPLGTTLPIWFGLGPFRCRTPAPTTVDLHPAPAPGALRSACRRGVAITHDSPLDISVGWPTRHIVLDLAPGHDLAADGYGHPPGSPLPTWQEQVPAGGRVTLTFPQEINRVVLTGTGFLFGLRVPRSASADPDEAVTVSAVLRGVRHTGSQPPPAPAFLGTVNLQEPPAPLPPDGVPVPPPALGFRLRWLPPYDANPMPWPPNLGAHPPSDAMAFVIERRRVDTGGPYTSLERDGTSLLVFGNRTARGEPAPLVPGTDLAAAFPEACPPEPPVTTLMDLDDVLVTEQAGGPPPGSLHQYRIFSVDVLGRRSASAATGSVVRLEKHRPPPRPVAPPDPPPPPGTAEPFGVRARVLHRNDEGLDAGDLDRLGTATNAVVLSWGWTDEERARDPLTREFRVYWQPAPPDAVPGRLTGPAVRTSDGWEMTASLDSAIAPSAMAGRYLSTGGRPHEVLSHTGGTSVTVVLRPSRLSGEPPAEGPFVFQPHLDGTELRPFAWAERVATYPVTSAKRYEHVLRDRLAPDAAGPLARAWIGVSAADGESYVPDEFPGGDRPGNESSIVPVVVQARYRGRPVLSAADALPDVPEHVTTEPVLPAVPVTLDLPAILPDLQVPAGHRLQLDRFGAAELVTRLGVTADGRFRLALPDGTSEQWSLSPPDHTALLAQIRGGEPGRIETRFLMDALLRHRPALETQWQAALPSPVPYGTVSFDLPGPAERHFLRVRLADQAGHLSAEAAVLPLAVRVPSPRPPGTPRFTAEAGAGGTVTVSALVGDSFDLAWLLMFVHQAAPADALIDPAATVLRMPNRRDLYPDDGVRLRLSDGTLLAPRPFDVAAGTLDPPYRQVSCELGPAPEKRLTLWAVALSRDGIPSPPSTGRTVLVPPGPLRLPALTVRATDGRDEVSWAAADGVRLWALERSLDGAAWTQVTPWLPAHRTEAVLDLPPGRPRRYRLAAQGTWSRSGRGDPVSLL